jgi:hypothetical protein
MSNYTDGGMFHTAGATLGMSDYNAGYPNDGVLGARVSGTNLGSASKPGELVAAHYTSLTWYAVFLSSGVPVYTKNGDHAALTAAIRPASGQATFPGTYKTFISGAKDRTVYNSDNTWSMPGFCDTGTYISFKVKVGTRVTYSDIQAENGCGTDFLWMAKEHGATKIGTATNQGVLVEAGIGVYDDFYAVLAG